MAGDIVLVTGVDELSIGTTLAAVDTPGLPPITVGKHAIDVLPDQYVSAGGPRGQVRDVAQFAQRLQNCLPTRCASKTSGAMRSSFPAAASCITILIENMRREASSSRRRGRASCCAKSAA
jgi:GTP-binding protein